MARTRLMFAAGALAGSLGTVLLFTVGSAGVLALRAADIVQPPAPAKAGANASASKVVLENERVRVKDVTFPAGVVDTGMHTHELAHVGIILTAGALTFTDPDGKKEVVDFTPGTVGFRAANATHMVAAPGPTPMRVIEVELKER